MSKIIIKRDAELDKKPIEVFLSNPSQEESSNIDGNNSYNYSSQTRVDGIHVPLIKFNNIVLQSSQIKRFRLHCEMIPMCEFEFIDEKDFIKTLENPTTDNMVQIQLIPSFDKIYKKINLTFYAYDVNVYGDTFRVKAIYFIPGLHDFKLRAFGKMTSYDFLYDISEELSMGFASNIEQTDDERYIYCPSKSYKEMIESISEEASSEGLATDCWIDYYDNINFICLESTFNEVETLEPIWVTNKYSETDSSKAKIKPIRLVPTLTNMNQSEGLQLYVDSYKTLTNGTTVSSGTDRMYQYFMDSSLDTASIFMQDGDMKNDIFTKYEYAGEVSGDFDYIGQKMKNKMFKDKVKSNTIQIRLKSPIFGLMKGCKVNLEWWITSSYVKKIIKDSDAFTNIDPQTEEQEEVKEKQVLDKQMTGQYYILESDFEFDGSELTQLLTLSRPDDKKSNYIKE